MLLAAEFPSWLSPEIIPGLPFRWYGLMYILAFGTAYLLYRRQLKERNFPLSDEGLSGLFFWGIMSLIMGARIFYALVYEPGNYYLLRPWLIFWPFRDGQFTGLQGMSYHGGVIGGALSIIIYSKIKKLDYREIGDMYAASIPLGYTFGRLGNFINGELYGRITASPLGIIFPNSGVYPWDRDFERIKEITQLAGIAGIEGPMGSLNFPRHPSQLYEMILEGIVLWAFIWFLRKHKPFKGFLVGMYLCGYGFVRFIIEYFREPDSAMGYPLDFTRSGLPTAVYHPLLSFSAGQILCFFMILAGLAWLLICANLPNREAIHVYTAGDEKPPLNAGEKNAERNRRKNARKKMGKRK